MQVLNTLSLNSSTTRNFSCRGCTKYGLKVSKGAVMKLQGLQRAGVLVPVIAGIMPIQSYASFLRVTKLCGTNIPPNVREDLQRIKASRVALKILSDSVTA